MCMTGKQFGMLYVCDKETVGTVLHILWQGNNWDCSTCVTVIRKQLGLFYMCDCNKETGLFYMCDCNKEMGLFYMCDCNKETGLFYMCDCNKETVGTVLHV